MWYQNHEEFFAHLMEHDAITFMRVYDVIEVLNSISKMDKNDIDEDIEVFFDVGYAYIYQRIDEIKHYLEKYFHNDLHDFLHFDSLINYSLYLDDLKEVMIEKESFHQSIEDEFVGIQEEIEHIIEKKKKFSKTLIDDFNNRLLSVIPSSKEFLTIPEIFTRALEELMIVVEKNG